MVQTKRNGMDERGKGEISMAFGSGGQHPTVDGQGLVGIGR